MHLSAEGIIGMVVIPFTDTLISTCWYASLPLYLKDLGGVLTTLGAVSALGNIVRMLIPLVASRFLPGQMELVKIPLQLLCIAAGLSNLMFPTNQLAIYSNVSALIVLSQRAMYQSLATKVWSEDRTSALRLSEAAYTMGYCMGSLWSGAAYYYGGWRSIVWVEGE